MKVKLTKGDGQVSIDYGKTTPPPGFTEGLPQTTLSVALPSGETLTSNVACHTGDQFVKRAGRFYAFIKLIDADTEQATEKALKDYDDIVLKRPEREEGLAYAAKAHYKLSRDDRRTIFAICCPEFFRNTPARKAQRERSIYERLKLKFEPETNTVKVVQKMHDVSGTVIGAVIGTVGSTSRKRAAK